jgi:hypothetical protein
MLPLATSFPHVCTARNITQDHEFDWLLCLASTFQACQRQPPIKREQAEKPSHSGIPLTQRRHADLVSSRSRNVTNSLEPRRPKVLLIGETPQGSSHLAKRLQRRGFECVWALSHEEACLLLRAQGFDLVLSPLRVAGGSAFSLVALLEGSTTTLFYFEPVENGCWWLPALRNGHNCFGSSALLPSEFVPLLDEIIDQICSGAAGKKASEQSIVLSFPASPATIPSSGESAPAEPKRAKDLDKLRRKAAG